MPLLMVRHARAGRRSTFDGDDEARPLSTRGKAQAEAIVPLLAAYRPRRILSSPAVRCFETVRPLADALELPIESVGELAEGNGPATLHLLHRMAGETAILSTHGDVATEVLDFLTPGLTKKNRHKLRLLKGEVWVIQSTGDTLEIVDHLFPDSRR